MRISGGEARGRPLKKPGHKGLRPTSDKVREALFSILGPKVAGASFLELFAGTGAVGLEALSRGAERAVFVDSSQKAGRLIRENLDTLGYRDRAAVVVKDVFLFIGRTAPEMGPFDLVFIDPPYHEGAGGKALAAVGAAQSAGEAALLSPGSTVVYEHFKKHPAPDTAGVLVKKRDYNYGDTVLSVYVLG